MSNQKQKYDSIKRIFDLIISVPMLVVLLPIFVVIGFMVRISMGAPVFFRQLRPGKNGKPFVIYKFRNMTDERGKDGNLLPDAERMTPLGRFLRKMSIDELPQLLNVIKGEMSLVGPRPLLMQYLNRTTPEQARRHEVKPGITGWASVNGRNTTSWENRFKLDVWYVEHQSFWLDLKILVLTILMVLKREGINQPGHSTMEEFNPCIKKEDILN